MNAENRESNSGITCLGNSDCISGRLNSNRSSGF